MTRRALLLFSVLSACHSSDYARDGGLPDASVSDGRSASRDAGSVADAEAVADAVTGADAVTAADAASAADAATVAVPDAAAAIAAFSAPPTVCAGSTVTLTYDFSGGSGLVEPGDLVLAPGPGTVDVTVDAPTTFTLSVGTATASATVDTLVVPDATITAPATTSHGLSGLTAQVPYASGVTYAWSTSANATIASGGSSNQVTLGAIDDTGSELGLTVTASAATTGCAATSTVHIPIPCVTPTLVSSTAGPGNEGTRPFAGGWAVQLVPSSSTSANYHAVPVLLGGTLPAGAPATLDPASGVVYDTKVASDDAGDAVFVWTQTTDFSTYTAELLAYRASDGAWSAAHLVGPDVYDQATPVWVSMDHATGVALVGWLAGPWNASIPHVRTYDVATDTLGADTPLRASTTNDLSPDSMDVDVQTDGSLDGFAAWYEHDSTTGLVSLYAVHLTAGVPDGAPELLVAGGNDYTTDLLNGYSPQNISPDRQVRTLAVSAQTALVVWRVYDYLAPAGTQGRILARRWRAGAWGPVETIDAQANATWSNWTPAVDDAGDAVVALTGSSAGFAFSASGPDGTWSAPVVLAKNAGYMAPQASMDPATGRAVVVGGSAALTGAFWDGATLSAPFRVDDPRQNPTYSGRVAIASGGGASILFLQAINPYPVGSNSTDDSLLYTTTCAPF